MVLNHKGELALRGSDIIKATAGEVIQGKADVHFEGISTDSRTVVKGNLFLALIGEKFNGHDFLTDVVQKGASGLVIQRSELGRLGPGCGAAAVIVVEDTLKALGDIAHFWRKLFSIPLLAITGSAGKTTTKEMTAAILGLERNLLKNEGNFNNLIGLPLSLLKMRDDHDVVVLEMGTNRPGEIARLTEIAEPTIGLITNVGHAHLEGLKSLEAVKEEKGDLFKGLKADGIAVVNHDDAVLTELADRRIGPKVTYGIGDAADVRAERIRMDADRKTRFDLWIGGRTETVAMTAPGTHNVYNALAAAASCWALGTAPDVIRRGLENFQAVSGRLEIIALRNGATVINDAYNANPDSVEAALRTLMSLKEKGSSVVVLGDMLELGELAGALHERIGESIGSKGVDRLFLRGDFAAHVAAGAKKSGLQKDRIFLMETTGAIALAVMDFLKDGDWVLIKGSRRMKMEEVTQTLIKAIGIKEE